MAIQIQHCVIVIDPRNTKAYDDLSVSYYMIGNYKASIIYASMSIKIDPDISKSYVTRGSSYHKFGLLKESLRDFNSAIQLDSEDFKAYNNRGWIYYKFKEYDKAIKDYIKAVEINPNYIKAYLHLGKIHIKIKKYDLSAKYLTEAIKLSDVSHHQWQGTLMVSEAKIIRDLLFYLNLHKIAGISNKIHMCIDQHDFDHFNDWGHEGENTHNLNPQIISKEKLKLLKKIADKVYGGMFV
jgi:tetratricopeptide (TPR) repeat protein